MDEQIEGLLPVVHKPVLLRELFGKEQNIPEVMKDLLPNYVSFEQLAIVQAKLMSQKLQ